MRKTVAILMAAAFALAACTSGGGATRDRRRHRARLPRRRRAAAERAARASPPTRRWARSAAGKLVCGVKFDVIAFGFQNPTSSEVEGFDADLCREIAAALGVEPEFIEAISANRIPFLQEDRVDIVISTMTRTDERLVEIDFSKIYYVAGQKILVKSDSPYQSVDDLVSRQRQGLLRRGLHVRGEPPGEGRGRGQPGAVPDLHRGSPGPPRRTLRRGLHRRLDPVRPGGPERWPRGPRRGVQRGAARDRHQEGQGGPRRVHQRRPRRDGRRWPLEGALRQEHQAVLGRGGAEPPLDK